MATDVPPPAGVAAGGLFGAVLTPSLRARMVVVAVAISLGLQAVLAVAIFGYQEQALTPFFNRRIEMRAGRIADRLTSLVRTPTDGQIEAIADDELRLPFPENYYVAVYDASGRAVCATHRPAPPASIFGLTPDQAARARTERVPVDPLAALVGERIDPRWRVAVYPLDPAPQAGVLLLALDDATFEQMMTTTRRVLAMVLPVGALATGAACWVVFGLAMAPLRRAWKLSELFDPRRLNEDLPVDPGVTELETFRVELSTARQRLRDALKAQDRLLSNISHELKTPIAVVLTEAQTLDRTELGDDGRRFVSSVTDEMRRLGRMINSFISLTRLRSGSNRAGVHRLALNDAVMESIARARGLADEQGVSVEALLPDADALVSAESELIGMVLDILIRRAVRSTPRGQVVGVGVVVEAERCLVRIRDGGTRIPPEQLDGLFDHFSDGQAPGTSRRAAGVGLATAQGVAELHGGRITARNLTADRGCEFTLELPVTVTGS